jgi:hypothetical protein
LNLFATVNFNIDCINVQLFWNILENIIINVTGKLATLTTFKNQNGPTVKPHFIQKQNQQMQMP